MSVTLMTIGDELLIGQVIDTNSAWMAQQLNAIGLEVDQILSVSDKIVEINKGLSYAAEKSQIVLITGGLGPTKDDKTKVAICDFFDTELIFDNQVLSDVERFINARHGKMNKLNRDQALVPKSATVLSNSIGTAPGLWIEKEGVVFVFMPGVPHEMKTLMNDHVMPRFTQKFAITAILHKVVLVHSIPEALLAERIELWEDELPESIRLAYLPSPGIIRLRLSFSADFIDRVDSEIQKLQHLIPEHILGVGSEKVSDIIHDLFIEKGWTLSVAESCTGGSIAQLLTSKAGASGYFKGGVVAYSNSIKEEVLNVDSKVLEMHGAVSEEVVKLMAKGILLKFNTDYSVAVSGVAGPGGGTPEKPVGTVWIAMASKEKVVAKRFKFGDLREVNILRSVQAALVYLLQEI